MRTYFAITAIATTMAAYPATAIEVLDIAVQGANAATVVTTADGLLEVDIAIAEVSPIALRLQETSGDGGAIAFNSVADFFTGITLGRNVLELNLSLTDGASFAFVGTVEAAFSDAMVGLNPAADMVSIRFAPAGEGFGVTLGDVFGGENFIVNTRGAGGPFSLIFNAAVVPEPASWGLMIAGFGLVGFAARRRRTVVPAGRLF